MLKNIPPIMTFKQCQEILSIGKNTLLDLLHSEELQGFRVGNQWRIAREDLEEFVEHCKWQI